MNSASVAGGAAPDPEHSSFPDPQSPVSHENFPSVSVEQSVLPQNRPPHEAGALIVRSSPFWRTNPVVGRGGTPALERSPGQTVYSHLFCIMKLVDSIPGRKKWEKNSKISGNGRAIGLEKEEEEKCEAFKD